MSVKRTSEKAGLGSSPFEPPAKRQRTEAVTAQTSAVAQTALASSSSSSSAPHAPYLRHASLSGLLADCPMPSAPLPASSLSTAQDLLKSFHMALGKRELLVPEKKLLRIEEIVDHPTFSSITDPEAALLLNQICTMSSSTGFYQILERRISIATKLLEKKPHLLSNSYSFNLVKETQSLILDCFNHQPKLVENAGSLFTKFILPRFTDDELGSLFTKCLPRSGHNSPLFFQFMMKCPEIYQRIPEYASEQAAHYHDFSRDDFDLLLNIPSIRAPTLAGVLLKEHTRERLDHKALSVLNKRPETLHYDVVRHVVNVFYETTPYYVTFEGTPNLTNLIFFQDSAHILAFISHPNFQKVRCHPRTCLKLLNILYCLASPDLMKSLRLPHDTSIVPQAQEALFKLLKEGNPQVELPLPDVFNYVNERRQHIPEEVFTAIEAAAKKAISQSHRLQLLANGLRAAPPRGRGIARTALERCTQNTLFEPRLISVIADFLRKKPPKNPASNPPPAQGNA